MQQRLINEEYKDIKENYKIKVILYFFASTFLSYANLSLFINH